MFWKSRNGAALQEPQASVREPGLGRGAGNANSAQTGGTSIDDRTVREWAIDHPWLALAGGAAAGFLATRAWSAARDTLDAAAATTTASRSAQGFDTRGLRRASAALWLIPLFEVARIGVELHNRVRQEASKG